MLIKVIVLKPEFRSITLLPDNNSQKTGYLVTTKSLKTAMSVTDVSHSLVMKSGCAEQMFR